MVVLVRQIEFLRKCRTQSHGHCGATAPFG